MPIECLLLKNVPLPIQYCPDPECGAPNPDFMRGQVQSRWRRLLGLPYCCLICWECKAIVGYEKPPVDTTP